MPTMRTRAKPSVPNTNPNPKVSNYEKSREERIKENLERMKNLGIMDLSRKLSSQIRSVKRPYSRVRRNSPTRDTPPLQRRSSRLKEEAPVTRRSSRLQNAPPVTYVEEDEVKKGKRSKEMVLWIGEGKRPEIYTEEHEKLLGNTERIWESGVDGCDIKGERIYDSFSGKTCHQCRQKTLGYRTQCSQCHPSVTGQFCGDCLYTRYGEHVLEALENPDWLCPIRNLGYKSVAHYLIQTKKQSETSEDDETDDALSQASARASSEEDHLPLAITDGENQTSVTDVHALGDLKPVDVNEMDPATPVIIDVDEEYEKNRGTRKKRKMSVKPNPDSIGGRLRQRRKSQA
ncbi:unnamed protein product [Arabis nemorensis]|uniref:Zinc-finger domain-containing protein n=1 Tax=Arabis nemorensis TaxID=586526 RepID=A0A565C8L5_9BRAS|nr:unnamed protein product [Arabis nemorensis]